MADRLDNLDIVLLNNQQSLKNGNVQKRLLS